MLCFKWQGMVDPGEVITTTIRREFGEETLNTLNASPEEKKTIEKNIDDLFCTGKEVRKGSMGWLVPMRKRWLGGSDVLALVSHHGNINIPGITSGGL